MVDTLQVYCLIGETVTHIINWTETSQINISGKYIHGRRSVGDEEVGSPNVSV